MTDDLFPREPRRMRQPRKDVLRDQLVAAADEIVRLRVAIVLLCALPHFRRAPWWRRVYHRLNRQLITNLFRSKP